MLSFFGQGNVNFDNKFYVDATIRSDRTSKLRSKNHGWFYGAGIAVDWKEIGFLPTLREAIVRLNYGYTGGLPFQGGLADANKIYSTNIFGNTFFTEQLVDHPNLKWEDKREYGIGMNLATERLAFSLNWYSNTFSDWIGLDFNAEAGPIHTNQNSLRSSGIELSISYVHNTSASTKWTSSFILSTFRSKFSNITSLSTLTTSLGGITDNPLIGLLEEEELGIIYGPTIQWNS